MKYVRVDATHQFADEPVVLYSELDERRMELRKVEIFRNGNSRTTLGSDAAPATSETGRRLASVEITREEFELVWTRWAR